LKIPIAGTLTLYNQGHTLARPHTPPYPIIRQAKRGRRRGDCGSKIIDNLSNSVIISSELRSPIPLPERKEWIEILKPHFSFMGGVGF